MALTIDYFRAVQGTMNIDTESEYLAANARDELLFEFENSINYAPDATRNGVVQPMIITGSEVKYKYNITTMPGDELYPGDIIEYKGEHYIVVQTRSESPVYVLGLAWLCNAKFRFQNWTPQIVERYGVLDSGVYSTTTGTDGTVEYLKRQFKIYLPSDEDTDKIYIDKRLAVGTMYDQYGNMILEAYVVTGRTKFGKGGYGEGAHLLELNAKSSVQVSTTDSIEQMICDYIAPEDTSGEEAGDGESNATLVCAITGRSTARVGTSRTYRGIFYDTNNEETTIDDANIVWDIEAMDGVTYVTDGASCIVTIPDSSDFAGSEIVVKLRDTELTYQTATLIVEVA